jgi:hypothetical protein
LKSFELQQVSKNEKGRDNKNQIMLKSKFNIRLTKIFFLWILFTSAIFAQNKYNFNQFGEEVIDVIERPVKWNATEYGYLAAIVGVTYGLMHIDESVRTEMLKDTSWQGSVPLEIARYWGEPITSIMLGGGFLLHGILNDNTANKKLGFEITQSFIYSGTINQFFKIAFGRARPFTGLDAFQFHPFQSLQDKKWSFPSGHTTLAFSLSTVISQNTKSDFWKVAAFIPAFATAFSRVNYNKHWTSDVFLGAFTGYFVAKYLTDLHKSKEQNAEINTQTPLISIQLLF